ncbi:MAG: hypothetical protein JXR44_00735 [Thiotrichales bacterium]|nr:hypothetical protein [Thiotrichales bacterium]
MHSSRQYSAYCSRQTGAITLFGVGGILAALFAFQLVLQYSNLKIIDRELDNYARSVAEVALRSELAITKEILENDPTALTKADFMANAVVAQAGYNANSSGLDGIIPTLNKEIVFGNFASDGKFYALGEANPDYPQSINFAAFQFNPRQALKQKIDGGQSDFENLPQFNAVAVQLWTNDDFFGFTPQGRALYGAQNDKECYCDVRYAQCVKGELTREELLSGFYPNQPPGLVKGLLGGLLSGSVVPQHSLTAAQADAIASAIAVPNSAARKNYCEYGFTATSPNDANRSKYPYIDFTTRQGFIGIPPIEDNNGLIGNLLVESNYSRADYQNSLGQLPIFIFDGTDSLSNQAGLLTTVNELLNILNPDSGTGSIFSKNTDLTNQKASVLVNNGSGYRCSLLTANVDLSLLGPLTDLLGLSQQGLAADCDSLLPAVGTTINSVLDLVTGGGKSCGLLGLGCLVNSLLEALSPLLDPVLGLVGADGLDQVLNDLLEPNVVVHDPIYIGRKGVCIYGTDSSNQVSQRCLSADASPKPLSCQTLLEGLPTADKPSLVNRLSIFLLGPVKDFSAAVESINCEFKSFRHKQPAFRAGEWQEVNP